MARPSLTPRNASAAVLALGLSTGWLLSRHATGSTRASLAAPPAAAPASPAEDDVHPAEVSWELDFGRELRFDLHWIEREDRRVQFEAVDPALPMELVSWRGSALRLDNARVASRPKHFFFVEPTEVERLLSVATRAPGSGPEGASVLRPVVRGDGRLEYDGVFGHRSGRPEADGVYRGELRRVQGKWRARFRGDLHDGVSHPGSWDGDPREGGVLEVVEVEGTRAHATFGAWPPDAPAHVVGNVRADGSLEMWVQMQ